MTDPVTLLQDLIRCPSVTPAEGGAISLIEKLLKANGFDCHRMTFSDKDTPDIDNLYARIGTSAPHFCFASHTDVVPTGPVEKWSSPPFSGDIKDGYVCGRGAADMKSGVAAGIAAALEFIKHNKFKGSISFLVTGDEEGPSINGMPKLVQWLQERGEKIDFCLLGEPTSKEKIGDMMKIGRRGTFSGDLSVTGTQGHVAYPHLADNPVPKLLKLLQALEDLELDKGTAHFQPSNLEITTIDTGNTAGNVIPAAIRAAFNIRFNDTYTGKTLEQKIRQTLDAVNIPYQLQTVIGGESFYTPPGAHSERLARAIESVTGRKPEASTSGGTSDARYIRLICPVIEFGLVGDTMHKIDERVPADDVRQLTGIYTHILEDFFKA